MSNSLGINFLRYINEDGANGWCQVFARLPFDEVELLEKGALFGVVYGEDKEKWGDVEAELTTWVEEFFNREGGETGLASFFEVFSKKFSALKAGWIWISKKETREVRMVGTDGVVLLIKRGNQNIDLGDKIMGKVVTGSVLDNDIYYLGTKDMGKETELWEEMLKNETISRCGLKIEVESVETQEKIEVQMEEIAIVMERASDDLVTDRYVGPIGWRERFRNMVQGTWYKVHKKEENVMIVGEEKSRKKRWSILLGVVFLVVLVASLVTGSIKMKNDEEVRQWNAFREPIEKRLNESLSLVGMNDIGAKKIAEETKQIFLQGKVPFEAKGYKKELEELDKKIAEVWTKVSGEKEGKIEELLNLELIRAGVEANKVSLIEKSKIIILGQVSGLVLSGDLSNKEVKVVAGKGSGLGWLDAVSDGTKTMIMTKGGISVVGKETQNLGFDSAVIDPVAMARFGKNIYVLEKSNKEIFKYAINDDGFGERSRWLKEGQTVKSVPLDMAIDVDIWVLGEGGAIERFRRGVTEEFVGTGLDSQIKLEKIAVDNNSDRVAVFGSSDGVVIICSKETGACNQQIINEKLKQARDIEFDEQGRLLVLFGGSVGVLN